jgi:hypothetical protein
MQGMVVISLALALVRTIVYYIKSIRSCLYPPDEKLMIEQPEGIE